MKIPFRFLLTLLVLIHMICLTSCGHEQSAADPAPTVTQPTRILGGYPPDYIYFHSFPDIADVRNTVIQTDESVFDHTVFGDRFLTTEPTPNSRYADKQTMLNVFDTLLDRSAFILSDTTMRLKLISARIERNDTISFGLYYDCSDNTFVQIRCLSYVEPMNRVTVKDSDITDILTFGEHTIVFAQSEQQDVALGWLYTEDTAFEFRCSVNALQDLQTAFNSNCVYIARLDELVNSRFTMSFSSFYDVAAFAQAANGNDSDWLAYVSKHPLSKNITRADAQSLLKTAGTVDLLHFKHDDVHLKSITWHGMDHMVFQTELSFQTPSGTISTRSPCPFRTYTSRDENNISSYQSGDDAPFIAITINQKSSMTFHSEDSQQTHTMHKADKNDIQLSFPIDDVMNIQREYVPTVESLNQILDQYS